MVYRYSVKSLVVDMMGVPSSSQYQNDDTQGSLITDFPESLLNEVASHYLRNDVNLRNYQRKNGYLVLPIAGDEKAVELKWILIDPWYVYFSNADGYRHNDLDKAKELSTSEYHFNGLNSPWIENDLYVSERPWLRRK